MESIKKLRESLKDCTSEAGIEPNRFDTYWITARACDMLIDEIEAEIAERFMELPCDADDVPIRVGDTVQFVNDAGGTGAKVEVCAVSNYYAYYGEGKHFYRAKNCRHVKPRTLEDVLREFTEKYQYCISDNGRSITLAKYTDEIRELLGVSE